MSKLIRRLRALVIALAVLALSATGALAGRSALSNPATQAASQHDTGDEGAGSGDAAQNEADEPDADEDSDGADADEDSAAADADEDSDGADAPDADPDAGSAGEHPDNHGKAVSEAAQAETPDGFDHHGAYVRTVAGDNHGHAAAGASTKTAKPKGKGARN